MSDLLPTIYVCHIWKGQRDVEDIERGETGETGSESSEAALATRREEIRNARKRASARCSICMSRTWFHTTHLMEPIGVPTPRQSWILCKRCHESLLLEMRRSPVLSPLRLRIAMGIVAADRSPLAYAPTRPPMTDRNWIVVMAWGFGIAMLLHLVLIVMLAVVAGH